MMSPSPNGSVDVTQQKKWTDYKKTSGLYSVYSPVLKSFMAGAFSGTCTTLLLQPFDLVKTRLQSTALSEPNKSNGMVKTLVDVVKKDRFPGLWRGLVPSLYRTVPGVGFYFSSLRWLQGKIGASEPTPVQAISLGMIARCIADLILLPVTVVKTRFESTAYKYQSTFGAIKSIYKLEGGKGLYSGLTATLIRDAPFSGIYLMFYTSIRKLFLDKNKALFEGGLLKSGLNFGCGVCAGLLASAATQPADVVKTHMQLHPKKHRTIVTTVQYIVKENGAAGLFRGIVPRCIRRTLMAALAWTVYEEAIVKLGLK